jgi:hypothetical protein
MPIDSNGDFNQEKPAVAIDKNNNIYVVWDGYNSSSSSYKQIYYSKYNGSTWSSSINLTNESYDQINPGIAVRDENNFYIAWSGGDTSSIKKMRVKSFENSVWSSTISLTDEEYDQQAPGLAIDKLNNVHLVWFGHSKNASPYNQIRYSVYNGTGWSSPLDLTNETVDQFIPNIAIDSANSVHVVWDGKNGSNINQIYYRKFNGSTWSTKTGITNESYRQYRPSIAIDGGDNIHVVWNGYITSSGYLQIRYSKFESSWSSPTNITSGSVHQTYPYIVRGGLGFVWQGTTDSSGLSSSANGIMFKSIDVYSEACPASTPTVKDKKNNGDGRDIFVNFYGAVDESSISEYRIFVVTNKELANFGVVTANNLASASYMTEAVCGNSAAHAITLGETLKDSNGNPIINGRAYNIIILSVGKSGYFNKLSEPSSSLTLSSPGTVIQSDFSVGTLSSIVNSEGKILLDSTSASTTYEDFEDTTYNFTFTGDWIRTTTTPQEGVGCLKNKAIGNSTSSSMQTTVNLSVNGTVSFGYRTSTQLDCDKLYFYIDAVEKLGGVSGTKAWSTVSFPITAGTHTLKWTYTKNFYLTSGEDSVYLYLLAVFLTN